MAHPICGKCHSTGVYQDGDAIACMICGNRYPGSGQGFYMSDKGPLNDPQGRVKSKNVKVDSAAESLSEYEKIIIELYKVFERFILKEG
ncbi:MAG: hypothetical protein Q8K00_13180 [Syntrophales bacterium]|nr:hypothetical protein [Syntrophales bacterium]